MNKSTEISTEFREKLGMKLIYILLSTFIFLFLLIIVIAFFSSLQTDTGFAKNLEEISGATGPIGDTLGGTLGPLIAIIASILTFWAFMEQYKANEIQIKSQNKNEFESRAFQLLNLSNLKREALLNKFSSGNYFENFFEHFEFNLRVYWGTHIGDQYSESTSIYFHKKFPRGEYGDKKEVFDKMIYYAITPILFGLKNLKFSVGGCYGYYNEMRYVKIDSNIMERKFKTPLRDYYGLLPNPMKVKILNMNHLKYGMFIDLASHIKSIKLALEYIHHAQIDGLILEKDADFFFKLFVNEMTYHEKHLFFLVFIAYQNTDFFISKEVVINSKIFNDLDLDLLRNVLTGTFIRFSSIEDYLNNKFY